MEKIFCIDCGREIRSTKDAYEVIGAEGKYTCKFCEECWEPAFKMWISGKWIQFYLKPLDIQLKKNE